MNPSILNLTTQNKKLILNWLRKINVKVSASDGVTYTNYQAAVSKWNKLNEHAEMDYNYPQPDYSTISQEIKNNK